jgi:hypothetical protein
LPITFPLSFVPTRHAASLPQTPLERQRILPDQPRSMG